MLIKFLRLKLFALIIIAVVFVSSFNILAGYLYLKGPLQEDKIVFIEKGLSTSKIAKILAKEGVINYPIFFKVLKKLCYKDSFLKHGEYQFTKEITPIQVIEKLISGKSLIHKLLIPEGLMVSEILLILEEEQKLEGKITDNVPEGYLMPSTYHYSRSDKRDKMISMMKQSMSDAIDEAMEQLSPDSPIKNRKELLILASIIEKEAGNDAERSMIAGVFINRLNKGMKLQADPTVAYAITLGEYKLSRSLSKKDLDIESPYSTYHVQGLPKGPICCPGKKSIMAVAKPAKTQALYFVVDGTGGHVFSNSFAEHDAHVQNYRQRQKAQKESNENTKQ